jgi:4a-hydroxytetrahydrobiopterin dehydratase
MSALPEHCVPCASGTQALERAVAEELGAQVPEWTLDFPRLRRTFALPDFRAALAWMNRVGMLAEEEQHHPDFHLTGWNRVELVLWTHAAGGLHANDFVLARRIDALWAKARV